MAACHEAMGLGPFPDAPIVEYLARSVSAYYAMLGGLLHDLGEMYIDPRYGEADADRSLDFVSYQQLVVHPHVGQ